VNAHIAVLPGDGVGPEVMAAALGVLRFVAEQGGHDWTLTEYAMGGAAIDRCGDPLPAETLAACQRADAVLLGAVGGPRWEAQPPGKRPESGLLGLRKALGVFANLRPVQVYPALIGASPLRPERVTGVDFVIVRELTGGLYFSEPRGRSRTDSGAVAVDTLRYSEGEIERVVRLAFGLARGRRSRLTSIDKANVLESSRLWREVVDRLATEYRDVQVQHVLVDSAAMQLVTHPTSFDVIVTENLFGDILSDEASVLTGSIGLLPSASLGGAGGGLYEPIHGSAPDIAGKDIANPLAMILSAALLLRHALQLEAEAAAVEAAVARVIADGWRTPDLVPTGESGPSGTQTIGTRAMGDAVVSALDGKNARGRDA
jgi:3-isopropylmalate dehydrogenase